MVRKVFQLKITLFDIKPLIWRKILVYSDTSLFDLHKIIQTTMGWENFHLYQFRDFCNSIAPGGGDSDSGVDIRTLQLGQVVKKVKDSIVYEYDFGDCWEHEIILEKIRTDDKNGQIPRCIDGKRNCPPEDCGGTWGYYNLLKILSTPRHPERREMMEWLGSKYNPNYFNVNEINESLMDH